MSTTSFATRLSAALSRVPTDMRAKVSARVKARSHELADLERAVERRPVIAAARRTKRCAKPRTLSAELDAAVADHRIPPGRRAHYERLAAARGTAAVLRILHSLSPGIGPATHALLVGSSGNSARDDDAPWMTPQRRVAPGQVLSAGRAPEPAGADPTMRPGRRARIDWSLDIEGSGPDLTRQPFTARAAPLAPSLGYPRANGHREPRHKVGRTPPGQIIDGGPGA